MTLTVTQLIDKLLELEKEGKGSLLIYIGNDGDCISNIKYVDPPKWLERLKGYVEITLEDV